MRKAIRLRGEAQKNIVKLIESFGGKFSTWEIWQDFIVMSAISISNVFDGPHRESREREYLTRAQKYSESEMEKFAGMLFEVTAALERDPDQDFLGDLFMSLNLGNEWRGQFFTPYSVCRAMAAMNSLDDMKAKIEEQHFISVNDPACGAGALLVAFANECDRKQDGINFQTDVLFVAQDIDYLAGCMCYIQLSLLGCPGYVVIADTISKPVTCIDARGLIPVDGPEIWYTPMYYRDIWQWRRAGAQLDLLFKSIPAKAKEAPIVEPPTPKPAPLAETTSGQLSFF